jgi:hypothetical protein
MRIGAADAIVHRFPAGFTTFFVAPMQHWNSCYTLQQNNLGKFFNILEHSARGKI